jgi:hypothetical protein
MALNRYLRASRTARMVAKMATRSTHTTMNPIAQWIVWLAIGAANALLFGIGGVIVVVVLLALAVRVAHRGDTMSAVSGLFVGFGATWLALLGRQSAIGGRLDDAGPWLALGIISMAFGSLVGVLRLIRSGRIGLLPR